MSETVFGSSTVSFIIQQCSYIGTTILGSYILKQTLFGIEMKQYGMSRTLSISMCTHIHDWPAHILFDFECSGGVPQLLLRSITEISH